MGLAAGSRRDHVPCGQHVYQGGTDGGIGGRIEFSAVAGWREYIGDVELRKGWLLEICEKGYGPVVGLDAPGHFF